MYSLKCFEDKDDIIVVGKDENENCICFVWLNLKCEYYCI